MRSFPYFFVRSSGIPYNVLEIFELNIPNRKLNFYWFRINVLLNEMSEILYDEIKNSKEDNKIKLIDLRRSLFNKRFNKIEEGSFSFNPELLSKWKTIQIKLNEIHSIERQLNLDYLKYRKDLSMKIKLHLNNATLLQGIGMSSHVFFNSALNYFDSDGVISYKSEKNIIKSLFVYLTRATCKTSPFSTFTVIFLGENSYEIDLIKVSANKDEFQISSKYRVNNHFLAYLKKYLVYHIEARYYLLLRLNPTIKVDGKSLKYIMNIDNFESLQELEIDEFLFTLLNDVFHSNNCIVYNDLINIIINSYEIERSVISKYIDDLIRVGLIEFFIPISGSNPDWLNLFARYLDNVRLKTNHSDLISLSNLLKEVQIVLQKLRTSDYIENNRFIKELYERVSSFFYSTSSNSKVLADLDVKPNSFYLSDSLSDFKVKAESFIYEDSYMKIKSFINYSKFKDWSSLVSVLFSYLSDFDFNRYKRSSFYDFFVKNYSINDKIPLLDFYQNLLKSEGKNILFNNPSLTNLFGDFSKRLDKVLKDYSPEPGNPIIFDEFILKKYFAKSTVTTSLGFFAQFINVNQNRFIGYLSSFFPGYGKMSSRFLHLFDTDVYRKFVKENMLLQPSDTVFVENSDNSYFNANLHPLLFEYEISASNSQNSASEAFRLNVNDLYVMINMNEIALFSGSLGKIVNVKDMGLQLPSLRSPLYYFLVAFTDNNSVPLRKFISILISKIVVKGIGYFYSPRIYFTRNMILSRKTWYFLKGDLPIKSNDETDFDHFYRVNRWKSDLNIPDNVFIYLVFDFQEINLNISKKLKVEQYKPQFISFSNPILVDLLNKLFLKCTHVIKIEEMLPNSNSLYNINGNKHVTEFLFHLYS